MNNKLFKPLNEQIQVIQIKRQHLSENERRALTESLINGDSLNYLNEMIDSVLEDDDDVIFEGVDVYGLIKYVYGCEEDLNEDASEKTVTRFEYDLLESILDEESKVILNELFGENRAVRAMKKWNGTNQRSVNLLKGSLALPGGTNFHQARREGHQARVNSYKDNAETRKNAIADTTAKYDNAVNSIKNGEGEYANYSFRQRRAAMRAEKKNYHNTLKGQFQSFRKEDKLAGRKAYENKRLEKEQIQTHDSKDPTKNNRFGVNQADVDKAKKSLENPAEESHRPGEEPFKPVTPTPTNASVEYNANGNILEEIDAEIIDKTNKGVDAETEKVIDKHNLKRKIKKGVAIGSLVTAGLLGTGAGISAANGADQVAQGLGTGAAVSGTVGGTLLASNAAEKNSDEAVEAHLKKDAEERKKFYANRIKEQKNNPQPTTK